MGALTLIATAGACNAPPGGGLVQQAGGTAGELTRQLDLSGTRLRNDEISAAARAARGMMERIDVHSFNETVAEINVLVREIRARVIAMPEETGGRFAESLEAMQLAQLAEQLRTWVGEASDKVASMDIDALNQSVAELRAVVGGLAECVDQFDVAAVNEVLADAEELQRQAGEAIEEVASLARELRRTVELLPVAEAQKSLGEIERAAAAVAPMLDRLLNLALLIVVGVGVTLIWALIWLRRAFRREAR